MASACVNNMGIPSENFMDCSPKKCPSYGWMSPRISFSRDFPEEEVAKAASTKPSGKSHPANDNADAAEPEDSDPEASVKEFIDFKFRLEDPVTMLPADELFSDGKLVPLHLRQSMISDPALSVRSADAPRLPMRNEMPSLDPYLFSPRAPSCTGRWKELLGLKKLYQSSNAKQDNQETVSSPSSHNCNRNAARGLKHFLHRGSKSALNASVDSSLNLPLLKESDNESLSISTRLSLSSSSSSGHEYDDLPRLSLDSDKAGAVSRKSSQITSNLSKVRVAKHRAAALSPEKPTPSTRVGRTSMRRTQEPTAPVLSGVSMDSPRMNSSGKVVFQSLERSSSSPSTFNGGPRYKYRGVERSYSANVRVTPVLNVPVCSLRGSSKSGVFGFPLFSSSSQQKKDSGSSVGANRIHQHHHKNRTDRT